MADAIRQIGVSEVTYYRWRQEFGGLKIEQAKRLKAIELEELISGTTTHEESGTMGLLSASR
jgi:hypothetical protein